MDANPPTCPDPVRQDSDPLRQNPDPVRQIPTLCAHDKLAAGWSIIKPSRLPSSLPLSFHVLVKRPIFVAVTRWHFWASKRDRVHGRNDIANRELTLDRFLFRAQVRMRRREDG
jgi:hypothetical protein